MSFTAADMHAVTGSPATVWRDWVLLLKPRVVSLVVFTGAIGLAVAPGHLHPVLAFTAVLCIAVAAGAAGCLNMWWERDIDARMRRTAKRPLPDGRIAPDDALAFGIFLSVASVLVMALATNAVAAVVLAVSIAFYVLIYTMWLKRRTPQNIVIGGAAGAFPPVIGWAAVTGSVDILPLLLFGLIFFWTPPHFWALSLYRAGDYAKAGVPMLPVVSGVASTKRHILVYSLALFPIALAPALLGFTGLFYGVCATLLGGLFLIAALRVLRREGDRPARRMFGYSIFYLFMIFATLIIDKTLGLAG